MNDIKEQRNKIDDPKLLLESTDNRPTTYKSDQGKKQNITNRHITCIVNVLQIIRKYSEKFMLMKLKPR